MGAIYLSGYETPAGLTLTGAPADPARLNRRAKRQALSNPTAGYLPSSTALLGAGSAVLDGQPVFTFLDIPRMVRDPKIRFAQALYKAPFQKCKFVVKAEGTGSDAGDMKLAQFVQTTIERFKRNSLPKLLSRYFRYGWFAGAAEFEARNGYLRLSRVRCVEPREAEPRVFKDGPKRNQFAGFNINSSTVPEGQRFVGWPHAMWFAGFEEYGAYHDAPPLMGAFNPWLEKNTRGGGVQLRQLAMRKNAGHGGILHHPPGRSMVGPDESPESRDNQDIARETLDYHSTGGTLVFENSVNPGNTQLYEWDYEPPEPTTGLEVFLDYPVYLDKEILEGIGIPLEVAGQGSDSGSGYKGRLISYGGFLDIVTELMGLIVESCQSWLTPLVRLNYGEDATYSVEVVSLSELAQEEEKRQPSGGANNSPIGAAAPGLPGDGSAGGGAGGSPLQLSVTAAPVPVVPNPIADAITSLGLAVAALAAKQAAPVPVTPVAAPVPPVVVPIAAVQPKRKFGCAMVHLPPELAVRVRAVAAKIPDAALAEDGREECPHVTARFGLHADDAAPVKKLVDGYKPFPVHVGPVSVFRGADCGKGYDVLKFDVDSGPLRRLHHALGALPHTDTNKTYSPHVTVAYVKAGLGDALAAFIEPLDAEFTADAVEYSTPERTKTLIPLAGSVELAATVTPEMADPKNKKAALDATQKRLMRTRKATIAQLLALAMVRKQQEATKAGAPEKAAGSLQALSGLANDPLEVARVVGLDSTELSTAAWEVLELGWVRISDGPRGGVRVQNTDTGSVRRGQAALELLRKQGMAEQGLPTTDKRMSRWKANVTAYDVVTRAGTGNVTGEDLTALAEALPNLTAQRLRDLRRHLDASFSGDTRKAGMVQKLLKHVDGLVAKGEVKPTPPANPEPETPAAPKPAPVPEQPKPAVPAPEAKAAPESEGRAPLRLPQNVTLAVSAYGDTSPERVADFERAAMNMGLDPNDPEFAGMIAALSSAQDGATVSVFGDSEAAKDDTINMQVRAPGYTAQRSIERQPDGALVVTNNLFEFNRAPDGSRLDGSLRSGTEVFAAQVAALQKLGASRIVTEAAGQYEPENPATSMSGYYSWPRMGYDGQVPVNVWDRLPANLKEQAGGLFYKSSVLSLMGTPEGREWWKKNGRTFKAKFDLTPDSRSLKTLAAYLKERDSRKGGTDGQAKGGGGTPAAPEGATDGGRGAEPATGGANPATPTEVEPVRGGGDGDGRERRPVVAAPPQPPKPPKKTATAAPAPDDKPARESAAKAAKKGPASKETKADKPRATEPETPAKRGRGNRSGKSSEVKDMRAILDGLGVSHEKLSDKEAVATAVKYTTSREAFKGIEDAVGDNANEQRLLTLFDRAQRAGAEIPDAAKRDKYLANVGKLRLETFGARRAADAEREEDEEDTKPTSVKDILAAERDVLAKRRAGLAARQQPAPVPQKEPTGTGAAGVWDQFQKATGDGKEWLATALHNGGVADPESVKKLPAKVDADRLKKAVAGAFQRALKADSKDGSAALERAVKALGGSVIGAAGARAEFDPLQHESEEPVRPGAAVMVVYPGADMKVAGGKWKAVVTPV